MSKVEELRKKVISCFATSPGPAYLNELIEAVRDEERANMKIVAETHDCPGEDNQQTCDNCPYVCVCDLAAIAHIQEEHLSILKNVTDTVHEEEK